MNKIEIIRSQFGQSSLYTPPTQNCANLTQFRPISDEKILGILNSMKNTTCDVYLCKINIFIAFTGLPIKNMDKDNQDHYSMAPFSSPGKKLLSGCLLNLVNCIGN